MIKRIFQSPKPIVAMVHLQYKGNLHKLVKETQRDVGRLERGGVDGLLFENWGGDYPDRYFVQETTSDSGYLLNEPEAYGEHLRVAIEEATKRTVLPFGINVLPLDYEAAFDIAKELSASFVQVDTFVDKVKTDYENRFILQINPKDVIDYRRRLGLQAIVLFTNIQTKHYTTIPANKKLETSAIQAIQNGADVLVVTGEATGKKTPKEKIIKVKRISEEVPVFIGSGFDVTNAEELLPYADGVIVGSSLKYDGITGNPVDEKRSKQLMKVVNSLRNH